MSSPEVIVITPDMPPTVCGVGDYTEKVMAHWPGSEKMVCVVPKEEQNWKKRLRPESKILLQYSGYGFDPSGGFPAELLSDLADWRVQSRGRLIVMWHEIWTFLPWWNRSYLRQRRHREALGKLVRAADANFTNTSSQAEHLGSLAIGKVLSVLPVGSNVEVLGGARPPRQRGRAIVFGMQPNRIRTLESMASQLRALAKTGRLNHVIAVGGNNSSAGDARECGLLEGLGLDKGFEIAGFQSAARISELLLTSELGLSSQDYLSYTKSGTFMAYASHGTNILSLEAGAPQDGGSQWQTSPAELFAGIDEQTLAARGEQLRQWYARVASWPRIAASFRAALDFPA